MGFEGSLIWRHPQVSQGPKLVKNQGCRFLEPGMDSLPPNRALQSSEAFRH